MRGNCKARRTRCSLTKRWMVEEERVLINFLLKNRNFEKPTAQLYYKRFIDQNQILLDWKQVRLKVQNMRTSYDKAKEWQHANPADSLDPKTVKYTLLKMFNFFYEFNEIFAPKLDVKEEMLASRTNGNEDDWESAVEDPVSIENLVKEEENLESDEHPTSFISRMDIESVNEVESLAEMKCLTNTSRKRVRTTNTLVSDIMKLHSAMIILKKRKLQQDFAAREKEILFQQRELALREKELELKRRQLFSQEKMKQMEMLSRERLKQEEIKSEENHKMLELKMNERLAMEELRLKYK